jgi:hypothetical protein
MGFTVPRLKFLNVTLKDVITFSLYPIPIINLPSIQQLSLQSLKTQLN